MDGPLLSPWVVFVSPSTDRQQQDNQLSRAYITQIYWLGEANGFQ